MKSPLRPKRPPKPREQPKGASTTGRIIIVEGAADHSVFGDFYFHRHDGRPGRCSSSALAAACSCRAQPVFRRDLSMLGDAPHRQCREPHDYSPTCSFFSVETTVDRRLRRHASRQTIFTVILVATVENVRRPRLATAVDDGSGIFARFSRPRARLIFALQSRSCLHHDGRRDARYSAGRQRAQQFSFPRRLRRSGWLGPLRDQAEGRPLRRLSCP